jgi:hypothetical protein
VQSPSLHPLTISAFASPSLIFFPHLPSTKSLFSLSPHKTAVAVEQVYQLTTLQIFMWYLTLFLPASQLPTYTRHLISQATQQMLPGESNLSSTHTDQRVPFAPLPPAACLSCSLDLSHRIKAVLQFKCHYWCHCTSSSGYIVRTKHAGLL